MKWIILCGCAMAFAMGVRGAEEATAPAPSPEEIMAGVGGHVIARPGGGWIQLTMEGVSLKVRFYDKEAKPVAPDIDRAAARFLFPGREEERRILVVTGDGKEMTHGRPLRPPHVFRLILTFFRGDSDEAVETHVLSFP